MKNTAQRTLAENLGRLMLGNPDVNSQPKLARRTHGQVSQRTVSNMLDPEGNTTLRNLQAVADALRVPAWMLLHPSVSLLDAELLETLASLAPSDLHKLRQLLPVMFSQDQADSVASLPTPTPPTTHAKKQ